MGSLQPALNTTSLCFIPREMGPRAELISVVSCLVTPAAPTLWGCSIQLTWQNKNIVLLDGDKR